MVFDLDEYMKQGEQQVKKNNDEFDLDVFLQQSGDNVIETPTAPVQKQKTARTYANQDISNMNPDEFRKNVDNLYDIPQVPMPSRHNAGYSNSDGEFRENLPTFAENHPVLNSVFNGIKQLPENAYNAISNIGNITQNAQPQVQYNGDTPLLTGGVSKKSFLNDQRYWLKTKANKFGDALLRIASNMGNSNPYGNLQPVQNPVKTTTNKNGQKIIDYSQESPMEQKIAGSRADYEKLKDIRSNPEKYSQTYNENDYEAVKNSYLQGNIDYKTAKNIYDQYNTANKNASEAARVVSEDAQRKIKNIEVGEAMLDTAFWGTLAFNILLPGAANIPTVGGKIVTGNLKNAVKKEATKRLMAEGFTKESAAAFVEEASKAGLVDRGVQVGLENYSKDMLAKYGINNAAGELAGKVATNAALAGTAGAIDMGLLSGGLNQYTNYLGVTDNNPLESVVGGAGQGALFAGALGGASPVLSQIAKSIGNMPIGKSYEPLKNSVDIYRGQNNSYNLSNGVGTGFTMGEGSPLQYADRMPQDVQYNGAENIQQIAPKTFEKMQAENAELPQANEVEQPQMSAKEQKRAEAKRSVIDRIKELAPKTAENIEKSPSEKSNDFYQLFKKHQFVKDNEGNVYESHVNQNGYIRNVDTDEHSAGDMKRTYEPYIPDEKEFVKKQEFKYEPNAKFDTNSHNYAFSQQEVVDAYNNYIKSPTVENREIYQDTYGEKTEEFHQKEEEFKNQIQKIAPKTAKKIQQEQAVEQKPKQYKVVNGKTVEVGSEAEKIANIAPKTAEKLQATKDAAEQKPDVSSGSSESSDVKKQKIRKNTTIQTYVGHTDTKETDKYFLNGNFIVRKDKFSLKGKGTTHLTHGDLADKINGIYDKFEKYTYNPATVTDEAIKLPNETNPVAVKIKYVDKDGNDKFVLINTEHLEKQFKGYDFSVSNETNDNQPIIRISDNGEAIGYAMPYTTYGKVENQAETIDYKALKEKEAAKKEDKKIESNGLPTFVYKVHKNNKTGSYDGLFMDGSNFYTDGNAVYLKKYVNADTSRVEHVTEAASAEKYVQDMLSKTSKYTNKLEDIGKGVKHGKETWRVFNAGEYDNGEPKHIVINDKFLLDKKNLEIYFDDNNLLAPLSIRKNGEQIGIVMPINKVDTSNLVDIKPIKITAKNETASNTTERKVSENKEIDISEQRKNKILELAKNIKESPDYNAEYAKETIEALAENSRFSKHHNNVELQDLIKDDWKNGDALAYIGQIYGNENGSREAQKQKGLEIIRKDVFNITNKNEQKTAEIDFSKYTTEELERAQQTYKANLGTAAEYGEEQYDAEKKMLDNINNELNKRKQKADKTVSKKSTNSEKYEDYGEKIWGAKKDLWVDYNKALKKDIDTDDISKIKLNDVFPEPNYEKLIQEGVKPELLAIVKACRDIVPTKPKGRKVYYYGKRWIDQLNTFRILAADILDGNITPEQIDASLEKVKGNSLKEVIDTYKKVGYPAFLNIKGFRISKDLTTWENGKELSPAEWRYWVMDEKNKFGGAAGVFKTEKEAVEFLQRVAEHTKEPISKSKDVKLVIYKYRGDKAKDGWVIGKKAGSNYIDLKKGFETSKEARNYLDENNDDLVKILEKLKEEPIVRTDVNEARIGGDYRNGEDATPEKFAETFGFRGVQFGNYVESAKRIDDINNAYDAFMDMIGIINIPEKAVSLNGTLGMAFGARGNGGKNPPAAHYEPTEVVINLTKMHGRGSLAHEWWHALDNYFGKMNNDVHGYATEHYTKRGEIRQEVLDAFADIRKTVRNALEERSLSIDSYRSKDYWSQVREMTARSFETYIKYKADKLGISNDYLANIINEELYNSEVKAYPYPKKAEMPEIEKAFDNFFKTIKTRKTDKGIELYNDKGLGKTVSEDIDVDSLIQEAINDGVKVNDVKNEQIFEGMEEVADEFGDYTIGKAPSEIFADTTYGLHKGEKDLILINNDAINKIEDEKVRAAVFKHTIRHEFEHARQYKEYTRILDEYSLSDNEVLQVRNLFVNKYKDLNQSAKKAILGLQNKAVNKMLSDIGLSSKEIEHVRDFIECAYVNERRQNYLDKHRDYIEKFNQKTQNLSDKEYENLAKQDKIIAKFREIDYDYRNCKFEANANKEADNLIGGNVYDETLGFSGRNKEIPLHAQQSNAGTQHKHSVHIRNTKQKGQKYQGQEINPLRPVNNETGEGIRQTVRDKVYQWHGDIESDRYDVDKSLNSFINLTKQKARDFSKKFGFNITDTQIREIMPFLRERTGLPKNLNRPELTKLYDALSDTEKKELTKLADNLSDKFEKYYKNYQDTKGEQSAESIENHISHIWDLDKKKKSLLTNYITTNSRFAKKRTIGTLAEGIDGIEINGEKVQFKPKTLDYAEILKSSSDNLIKAAHDSVLANEIKNLRYQDKPLVLPASKAPEEWIEVSHPVLNKAVYMGAVGENELPMLMKTPVKVHPEIADYVSSIFEVQKNSDFWNTYDSLNGMIKQLLLGFSGFHGYALSESSIGNAGVMKTMQELNPKKFVDAIKNGNYDIYKNEEAAKRAIRAGVQLGTPSDLQRNLVEETLKKIPFVGRYIAGGVSANNKILWDVLHNNFKILAFNTAIENIEAAAKRKATVEEERTAAQWVNDSFGGQAWELLGIKNSAIKAAGRILLSPDWNFSTIRQAAAAINSEWADDLLKNKRLTKLLGIEGEAGSNGARGKIGRAFWFRAALFSTVFYNLINAAFREKDRKENPKKYPEKMTPADYSIWANSYPMDNIYDRIMPKVFIGRNSDGTARMLRVGKQFREVPEMLSEPIVKFGGKTSPLINVSSQVGLGMSPSDFINRAMGEEAYLNQDIWDGYGMDAEKKEGLELAKGRAVTLGKSLVPYIGSRYISGKHEFSTWDFVAQTNAGASKGKVFKQTKEALKQGKPEKIDEIEMRAYQDGLSYKDIRQMVGYAKLDYKAENTKKYKKKLINSFENKDEKEYDRVMKKMQRKHLSQEEQRRIREKAWEDYTNK